MNGYKIFAADILDFFTFYKFSEVFSQLVFYDDIVVKDEYDLCWIPDCASTFINFSGPKLSTIHDCAHIDELTTSSLEGSAWIHEHVINDSRRARKIITVSNFSKKRLMEEYGIPTDRCKVIYIRLAKRIDFNFSEAKILSTLDKYGLRHGKYFIFVSSLWGHKNHANLLKAFIKFERNVGRKIKLAIVGTHKGAHNLKKIIADNKMENLVVFTDFVSDADLAILLSNALACVHPSLYEGFGMPIIEAMNCGIPVICSNVASLPEIAEDAALFFDPYNICEIADTMATIAADSKLRKQLVQRGYRQAAKFVDTERMINEYIETFEEVMKSTATSS
jgi:glycosyltransferase involved in cell wall biosynthesis